MLIFIDKDAFKFLLDELMEYKRNEEKEKLCPVCKGSGEFPEGFCGWCQGTGLDD